jgi:hypothetical protein
MKLVLALMSALCLSSAHARPLKAQVKNISGKVKLLIDMDQVSEPVDILFVVDNSASMAVYQNAVAENTNAFMDQLSAGGGDWRIALVSTSVAEAPYIGMGAGNGLDHTTPGGAALFKSSVARLGIDGDTTEKAFDSINGALAKYPDFLRANAQLAIIVVSDAAEQSVLNTADLLQTLTALKGGDSSKISFYGFLNPTDWCPDNDEPFVWAGSKYQDFLNHLAGDAKPICGSDFGANLVAVGKALNKASRAGNTGMEIPLPSVPVTATVTVNFGTQIIDKGVIDYGWLYNPDKNSVLLGDKIPWSVQPAGTPLEVTYTPKDWSK